MLCMGKSEESRGQQRVMRIREFGRALVEAVLE